MTRRWTVALFILCGCTPGLAPLEEPTGDEREAPAPIVLPASPDEVADVDDRRDAAESPQRKPLGAGCLAEDPMIVRLTNAAAGESRLPPHYDSESSRYAFGAELDGRALQVSLAAFELTHAASGNGNIIDLDVLSLGGGIVLVAHHNLDEVVDPPRFFRRG